MTVNTYDELIPSITLSSNTTTVTLSSIPQGYTDLRVVIVPASSSGTNGIRMRINSDTGSNYSGTYLGGNGTSAASARDTSNTQMLISWYTGINTTLGSQFYSLDFMNYTSTTTNKTVLMKTAASGNSTEASVGLWRSTSAITSLSFNINSFGSSTGDFITGSTFSLYGIKAWVAETTPKATGGYVTQDSTYWYHSFLSSDNFVPNQTVSCDYVVVAGGGGGGGFIGGGGGAGGYRSFTSTSISAGTYPIVIGAGGIGGYYGGGSGSLKTAPTTGNASSFNGSSSAGGGGGAYFADGSFLGNATSGGSGGGGSRDRSPGSGNTPSTSPVQGYAGGTGQGGAPYYNSGGGGGASAAGSNAGANSGKGGDGINWLSLGTFYAGGGGGAPGDAGGPGLGGLGGGGNGVNGVGVSGTTATGGGGGGGNGQGGSGGGGIVIVRYAK
jgi:hypothetical protein